MSDIRIKRVFIIIMILFFAFAALFMATLSTNNTFKIFFTSEIDKNIKEDIYNVENKYVSGDSTVFFGDSITEMYDLDKFYKGHNVVNRGISSETSYELLDRLTMNVMSLAPRRVIILVGTNDIAHHYTNSEIVNNIMEIVTHIRYFSDTTEIIVESILPVNNSANLLSKYVVKNRTNENIDAINRELERNARYYDYTYIYTASTLKDENGNLKKDFTVDGLHLSKAGYSALTDTIKEHVQFE